MTMTRDKILRAIQAGRCGDCGAIAWDGHTPDDCPKYGPADYTWGCFWRPATDDEKADAVMAVLGDGQSLKTEG
jgi:hypothetical protein